MSDLQGLGCATAAVLDGVPGPAACPRGQGRVAHRAGEFPLVQGKVKRNAVCLSSGVGFTKALCDCIPVE